MKDRKVKMETVGGVILYTTCLVFILMFITSAL